MTSIIAAEQIRRGKKSHEERLKLEERAKKYLESDDEKLGAHKFMKVQDGKPNPFAHLSFKEKVILSNM